MPGLIGHAHAITPPLHRTRTLVERVGGRVELHTRTRYTVRSTPCRQVPHFIRVVLNKARVRQCVAPRPRMRHITRCKAAAVRPRRVHWTHMSALYQRGAMYHAVYHEDTRLCAPCVQAKGASKGWVGEGCAIRACQGRARVARPRPAARSHRPPPARAPRHRRAGHRSGK